MPGERPSRRRLLGWLGVGLTAATAGCLGSGDSNGAGGADTASPASPTRTDDPSPTARGTTNAATPPAVETPAVGECEPLRPTPTTPASDGLDPATYPELPDEPSAERAESFAGAFERAYTKNAVVAGTSTANVPGGIDRLSFYDASTGAKAAGSGYLVDVSFSLTYEDDVSDETPPASGRTPSPAPTGHTSVSARYYVTGRFALRQPGLGGVWTVVACA